MTKYIYAEDVSHKIFVIVKQSNAYNHSGFVKKMWYIHGMEYY